MPETSPLDAAGVTALVESWPEVLDVIGPVCRVESFGEGKLNAVFGVWGDRGAAVLKQALPWIRVLPQWSLTVERTRREAWFLDTWAGFNGAYVPASYGVDPDRHLLAMELLTDHVLWRSALHDGEISRSAAESAGVMLARTAFFTSPLGRAAADHARGVADAANPEMDAMMIDVVFDIPFTADERNTSDPQMLEWRRRITGDERALRSIADLRWIYTTRREAALHGDLHTGSLMVQGDRIRVIDGEFARYGPVAWDLGALWCHLTLAVDSHRARGNAARASAAAELVPATWDGFTRELRRLWAERVTTTLDDAWLGEWLEETRRLAVRFAGLESIRRIVGIGTCEQLDLLPEPLRGDVVDVVVARGVRAVKEATWT